MAILTTPYLPGHPEWRTSAPRGSGPGTASWSAGVRDHKGPKGQKGQKGQKGHKGHKGYKRSQRLQRSQRFHWVELTWVITSSIPVPLIRRTREIMGLEEPGKPKNPGEIKKLVNLGTRKQINQGDNRNQRIRKYQFLINRTKGGNQVSWDSALGLFQWTCRLCSVKDGLCSVILCSVIVGPRSVLVCRAWAVSHWHSFSHCDTCCLTTRTHDDIIIIAKEEEERVTVRISKQTESHVY